MRHALPLLLLACNGPDDKTEEPPVVSEDAPAVRLDPDALAFGRVEVGDWVSATVSVANVGDEDLEILSLELEDAVSAYTISAIGFSPLVPPGGSTTFDVTFDPDAEGEYATAVLLETNAADEPARLPVTATGVAATPEPELVVSPVTYPFGTLYVGCEDTLALALRNEGSGDLVVSDLAYTGDTALAFDPDEGVNGPLPWTLAPGASVEVRVTYAPIEEGSVSGTLVVTSDDPDGSVLATQSGAAVRYGTNIDTFDLTHADQVDIVFTLDTTASMSDEAERLAEALPHLVDTLMASGLDYQLGITIADDGCIVGEVPFVDGTMSEAEQVAHLTTMLAAEPGRFAEMGFTVLEAALGAANLAPGGCNEGLVREGALALVGIADEPEQSPNPWVSYVSIFQSLKSRNDLLTVHAIAGDWPSGCGSIDPGVGWYEATAATGGQFLSICTADWSGHMEDIVDDIPPDTDSFELSSWPVPETIVVTVDGEVVDWWVYDETNRTIDFHGSSSPEAGSVVKIEYALYGDCEP